MQARQRVWTVLRAVSVRLCIGKRYDYVVLLLLGALPVFVAFLISAGWSSNVADGSPLKNICPNAEVIKGYFVCPNWMMFPLALPLGLWVLRWMSSRLCAVRDPFGAPHPLVQLLPRAGQDPLRQRLLGIALDGKILMGAFTIATLCMIVDLKEQEVVYWKDISGRPILVTDCPRQYDWTFYCLSKLPTQQGYASPQRNLILILSAYTCQYLLITFAFTVTLFIVAHNLVYLKTVFRRSVAKSKDMNMYYGINFDDYDARCFGLKGLHGPFNAQLVFLSISGTFILVSRFANVGPLDPSVFNTITDAYQSVSKGYSGFTIAAGKIPFDRFFPTKGQVMLATGWVCCFSAVMMPVCLKFLPLFNREIRTGGIIQFLLEFIKYDDQNAQQPMSPEVCDNLANKFAQNSFWPTGDRRARVLFYFAFIALFLILFPVVPSVLHPLSLLGYSLFLAMLAVTFTSLFFLALRIGLSHVDERLSKPAKGSEMG